MDVAFDRSAAAGPAIDLRALTKRFRRAVAVDGVTVDMPRGLLIRPAWPERSREDDPAQDAARQRRVARPELDLDALGIPLVVAALVVVGWVATLTSAAA
jgi:hypothetical protein